MNVFNQTVTLINVSESLDSGYQKTILTDCMWKSKKEKVVENNQLKFIEYYSVTIPYQGEKIELNAENNQDLLILGELKEDVNADNYEDILKRKNVGIISSVVDNTMRDRLKHWKVVCM